MQKLKTLVAMQLKDKIDLSFVKDKKQLLRTIIFSLLKFIIIVVVAFVVLQLAGFFGLFFNSEFPQIMILIITLSLLLSLVACTIELMKNLYFSEDNKVLITLPVDANKIFISKIIVFYIYELKRSLTLLFPLTLACTLQMTTKGLCPAWVNIWMIIVLVFIVLLPVLLGSLLSIVAMFVYRLFKKAPIIEIIAFLAILVGAVLGIIYLIGLIPTDINLIKQWPTITKHIRSFLLAVEEKLTLMSQLVRIIIGERTQALVYRLNWFSFVKFLILILSNLVLFCLGYVISRPLFFKMMAKSFETDKKAGIIKPNHRQNKYLTFIDKEFKINIRTINISINYLIIYIIVPILILFLNTMYKAMNTRILGDMLIYTFNILLICLPLLASNALVATYYSREGRAGYIKKTKPISAVYPLIAKLFFNILFSIPTVFITTVIFGKSVTFGAIEIIMLGFAILFLHLGHMFYSASLDIMNPQNEQYATTGTNTDNPNENKSTLFAFILAIVFAFMSYVFLSEAHLSSATGSVAGGVLKLMLITLLYFVSMIILFLRQIKAFYYEIQGR